MQSSDKTVARKQKNYSLPLPVADWIHDFFEANKTELSLIGITSETKLLEVLARNGEQSLQELLQDLKVRREARQGPAKITSCCNL